MNNSSSSKLGGQCLVAGGIISFIIFIIQILVSGPPPGNEHIFSYFANETLAKGSETVIYTLFWTFGNVLIAFGILALNGSLQEKQKDGLLALGSFLFIVGQIGFMIATSIVVASIKPICPTINRKVPSPSKPSFCCSCKLPLSTRMPNAISTLPNIHKSV